MKPSPSGVIFGIHEMQIEARGHWVTKRAQNKGVRNTRSQDTHLAHQNLDTSFPFISGVLKQEACATPFELLFH